MLAKSNSADAQIFGVENDATFSETLIQSFVFDSISVVFAQWSVAEADALGAASSFKMRLANSKSANAWNSGVG